METYSEVKKLRTVINAHRLAQKRIAFVPTMGNLHEGHLTLVRQAQAVADIVIVSIFVNPMQFENADDLVNYPRTLDDDLAKLAKQGVDAVFTPTPDIMYPKGLDQQTFVEVPNMSNILEGESRPGHFRGVATIVTKLFNIVQPDVACFGEKDFQQLAVIRQMTEDLCLDIEIIGVPTVRESDGLAMSSRNNRLTTSQRTVAPHLARIMKSIGENLVQGERDTEALIVNANSEIVQAGMKVDEIFIRDEQTLQPINQDTEKAVVLMAAFLGDVRLIDNQVVSLI
ncbi:pantoate--beta-alanine ligase [Vibrio sp. WJH972]